MSQPIPCDPLYCQKRISAAMGQTGRDWLARQPFLMARQPFLMARQPFLMACQPFLMARQPKPVWIVTRLRV